MTDVDSDLGQEMREKAAGLRAKEAQEKTQGVVAKAVPTSRLISLEECKQHVREEDCWLVIHGKVHDVTQFLDEHPGGFDILISSTGKDASEDFDEIGHSKAAKDMLAKYIIGDYEGGDAAPSKPAQALKATPAQSQTQSPNPLVKVFQIFLPVLVILAAIYLPRILFPSKQSS
ncbi:hypothetical protein WJX73_008854 [Symbiochloris irregularis]|uniref:Cytochrome b5 heme-binding domain-containing protein n=1 Tax=Symbiochloris irregularis TaxID=706552 RepID=A0AAW1NW91_9CHLO